MTLPLLIDESSSYKVIIQLINQIKSHGVRKARGQGCKTGSGYFDKIRTWFLDTVLEGRIRIR